MKDLDASIRFYTTVLGMTGRETVRFPETGGTVVDWVSGGSDQPLELNYYEGETPFITGDGLGHLGFAVLGLDRALAEATRAGHPVVQEIRISRSRWVYIRDPNGIGIELMAEYPKDPCPREVPVTATRSDGGVCEALHLGSRRGFTTSPGAFSRGQLPSEFDRP